MEGKNEEMQDAIKRLEQMVLLNPTNIEAAKLLSQSLEKALFAATTNRFQEQIKINAAKLNNLNRNAHGMGLKDTQSNAPDAGYAEAKQEATANQTKYNPEDIQQLLSQNENLRTTVTQLRQKLAQYKQAQDRTAGHSSLYGTPKNKVPKDDASHPNSRGKGKSDFATDAGGDGGGNNGTSSNNFHNEFQEEATHINNLPDILQAIILSRLKLHISQLIAGNGYYQTISSNVELLAVIVEEVINQVSTSIFHIFEIHLKTKPELAAIQEAKEKNMINEEFLDSNRDSLALIFEQVDQIFRFTHVHAEIIGYTTMYVTYLFARSGTTESFVNPEDDASVTSATNYSDAELSHGGSSQGPTMNMPLQADGSLRGSNAKSNANLPRYMMPTKSFEQTQRPSQLS